MKPSNDLGLPGFFYLRAVWGRADGGRFPRSIDASLSPTRRPPSGLKAFRRARHQLRESFSC